MAATRNKVSLGQGATFSVKNRASSSLFTSQARPEGNNQLPPFQAHMGNDSSFLPEPSFLFPGSL